MKIEGIIWLNQIVDKLVFKHQVETFEVEEVLVGKPKFRFVEKDDRKDEDVYMALGQTDAGRYLTVLFIHKQTREALVVEREENGEQRKKNV